ncbi:MAG: RNA polymerase sigma factor [Candidatus Cloacimonetes bacterium]|nr:RNA polymerase sigma factor [Candidatus Cloacimonadota bacterium]
MALLKQGNDDALDELYKRYSKKLFIFCRQMIFNSSQQDAEDLVQNTFFRVIKAADRFNPHRALFRTWLFTIARNLCLDELKKKQHHKNISMEKFHPSSEILVDHANNPEEELYQQKKLSAVNECLENLDNIEEKQAVLLYFISGKVFREIGQIINKSTRTAKNKVDSAIAKIRICLKDKGYEIITD